MTLKFQFFKIHPESVESLETMRFWVHPCINFSPIQESKPGSAEPCFTAPARAGAGIRHHRPRWLAPGCRGARVAPVEAVPHIVRALTIVANRVNTPTQPRNRPRSPRTSKVHEVPRHEPST